MTDKVQDVKNQVTDKVQDVKGTETEPTMPEGLDDEEQGLWQRLQDLDKPGTTEAQQASIDRGYVGLEKGGEEEADVDDVVDGPSELNEVVSTDLQPTTIDIPQTELGSGTYQTNEPYGSGEGDIEMKTLSSNESSNAELAETDANDFHEQLDTGNPDANANYEAQVDNPVEQTVEQETTQIGEDELPELGADIAAAVLSSMY